MFFTRVLSSNIYNLSSTSVSKSISLILTGVYSLSNEIPSLNTRTDIVQLVEVLYILEFISFKYLADTGIL